MKVLSVLSVAFFAGIVANTAFAEVKQKLNIDAATIFLSGAELTSTAKVTLIKGENEVLFTNVAGNVNLSSLIVNATNGVAVEGATFQNNYLSPEALSPKAKEIKDSIDQLTASIPQINNKIAMLNEQIVVLQSNRKVNGDNTGLSVTELTKMLDLIAARMETLLNVKTKQDETLIKVNVRIGKLNQQLEEEQKKAVLPGGQLLVKFYAKEATTSSITIDYVVAGAGWKPTYDIMADDATGPVKLYYKANVFQNTGVKWDNVKLSLSTGNPTEGINAPALNPWFLSIYVPPVVYNNGTRSLATTSTSDLVALTPGIYQNKRGADINSSGGRTSGNVYVVDGVQVQGSSTIDNFVSVDNSGVNTTFDIDLPYTVPSDGKMHMVAIKKYSVPASYSYYAVPKLDKDAFLQAQITQWEDLNLLPGETNIFYEGSYVGQGYIDMRNLRDTMIISLGRDKKIIVKREMDTKYRSEKTIGTNVREEYAFTIKVRNTRKQPVSVTIQDQMPVSNDKDIEIEDINKGESIYDESTGIIKWQVNANSNETKNLKFGYTVKYPRGKTVVGLR